MDAIGEVHQAVRLMRLPHSMAFWAISITAWRRCMTCSLARGVAWQSDRRKSLSSWSRVISLLSSTWISP